MFNTKTLLILFYRLNIIAQSKLFSSFTFIIQAFKFYFQKVPFRGNFFELLPKLLISNFKYMSPNISTFAKWYFATFQGTLFWIDHSYKHPALFVVILYLYSRPNIPKEMSTLCSYCYAFKWIFYFWYFAVYIAL